MHFERRNALKLYFILQNKKYLKKNVCLPYLKCSDLLPETHLFFYLALPELSLLFNVIKR